jgi:hypothetical protein
VEHHPPVAEIPGLQAGEDVNNSDSATGQPVVPGQVLQATFSLVPDSDDVAHIHLFIDRE